MSLPHKLEIPKTATQSQVFEAIKANIHDKEYSEDAQRNFVIRILALLGYGKAPKIMQGTVDGDRVRVYLWADSPAGDVILLTGPQFRGKLLTPSEIEGTPGEGMWFAAFPDRSKAADKAKKTAEHWSGVASHQREVVRKHEREQEKAAEEREADKRAKAEEERVKHAAPRPAPKAAPASRKAPPSSAADVAASERQELKAGFDRLAELLK